MAGLLEKLEDQTKDKQPGERPRGSGVQIFLAQRDEIAKAVAARYPYQEIYAALQEQGSMPIGYRSFCTYIWRFITSQQAKDQKAENDKRINNLERSANHADADDEELVAPVNKKPVRKAPIRTQIQTGKPNAGKSSVINTDPKKGEALATVQPKQK